MSLSFSVVLPFLYSLVGLVGAIGYVPQVYNLAISTGRSLAISLPTWYVWLSTWVVSFLYAVFIVKDTLFMVVAGINILGHLLIITLTIYNRYYRFQEERI